MIPMKWHANLTQISTITLSAISLMGFSASTLADQSPISITPSLGIYKFDDDLNIDDEAFGNLALQYRLNERVGIEASYGASETNTKNTPTPNDLDWQYARVDGLYYFNPGSNIQPYLAAGVGEGRAEVNNEVSDETLVNIGGGLQYLFNQALSVRADLRAINSQDEETTSGLASLALSYVFGSEGASKRKPAPDFDISAAEEAQPETATLADTDADGITDTVDQCDNTPPSTVVDANGCILDSDFDGIADSQDQCSDTPNTIAVDNEGCPRDLDQDGIADAEDSCPETNAGTLVDAQGCAVSLSQAVPDLSNIGFASGSYQLQGNYVDQLANLATFMRQYETTLLTIEGHTDSSGNAEKNSVLSEQRADEIRKVLISEFGIDPDRLKVIGFGESKPIATNDTLEGRAKNRRVITRIESLQ